MDIKERFKNLNIKNVLLIIVLGLTFVLTIFNTYQVAKINRVIASAVERSNPAALKRPSEYKIGMDYKKAIKTKKPMLMLFYADWCGFCIRFMPTYEKLYKAHKRHVNFVKINVEDPKYINLVNKYEIKGFPSVFLVNTKKDESIQLDNYDFTNLDKLNRIIKDFYKKNK